MPRLSHQQLRNFSTAVGELYESPSLDTFGDDLIRIFARLIPAGFVCTNYFDGVKRINQVGSNQPFPCEVSLDFFFEHQHQNPLVPVCSAALSAPYPLPFVGRWSDVSSLRQIRRTGLYQDFYRPLGIFSQIALMCPGASALALAFNRGLGDFTAEESGMLLLLAPHFQQAYRQATVQAQMRQALSLGELAAHHQATLIISGVGNVLFATAEARRLCRQYHWLGEGNRLRGELSSWLAVPPAAGAKFQKPNGKLVLTAECLGQIQLRLIASDFSAAGHLGPGDISLVRLTEKPLIPDSSPFRRFGLTPKEAEILLWIKEGKTNAEIAIILESSPHTIRKHVEHILAKLGVESRGAAAALACEVLP